MKIGTSYRQKPRLTRALPGLKAPTGAIVMGAYLFGMTGIAAGAYAMRDVIFNIPVASTAIPDRLQQPEIETSALLSPSLDAVARHSGHAPQAPRLAALTPPNTRLDDDLLSPLSRIFLGQPPLVPPTRPGTEALTEPAETAPTDETDEDLAVAAALGTSLRPRQRPDDLPTRAAAGLSLEEVQLASLTAPDAADTETALVVPDTPRISPKAQCSSRHARDIPRRRGNAPDAKTFMASISGIDGVERDRYVMNEILKGNMPRFLHKLVPVSFRGTGADGRPAHITLCVTPDYLALGSDRDFVRVPLGLRAATRIAEEFNMLLPTPRMVDTIYRQASLRLSPKPMTPGPQMTSTAYFVRHNATVEAQRQSAGAAAGTLISGHKKDVVLTSRLASNRGRVAIYGWHRPNGQPIQPLSTVHGAGYADYSHGVRLVSRTAYLNGREVDLTRLMSDPNYAGLISHEGPLGRSVLASN